MAFDKGTLNSIQRERYDRLVLGLSIADPTERRRMLSGTLVPDAFDLLKVPGALSAAGAQALGK